MRYVRGLEPGVLPSSSVCQVPCLCDVADKNSYLTDYRHASHKQRPISDASTGPNYALKPSQASVSRAPDLSSLLSRDSARMPRYPEKLIKALDGELPRIAMGQHKKYVEQRFRRIVAAFWSSAWPERGFQKQMKESRKVEDLVIQFVSVASRTLRKDDGLGEGLLMAELNRQITTFMELLVDLLRDMGPSTADLVSRIEGYKRHLRDSASPHTSYSSAEGAHPSDDITSSLSGPGVSDLSAGDSLLLVVVKTFALSPEDKETYLRSIKSICSEEAALNDMKLALTMLAANVSPVYTSDDFREAADWLSYKTAESEAIQNEMLYLLKANPNLTQSNERGIASDLSVKMSSLGLDDRSRHSLSSLFTFIPPHPRNQYQALLNICLDRDLDELQLLPEDQEVSLGILSAEHQHLLLECSRTWRLPETFRAWSFLAALVQRLELGMIPAECVHEAIGMLAKVTQQTPVETWPIPDQEGLRLTLQHRDLCLVARVANALEDPNATLGDDTLLMAVKDCQNAGIEDTVKSAEISRILGDIGTHIRRIVAGDYKSELCSSLEGSGSMSMELAVHLSKWVEKRVKRLHKNFHNGFVPTVDMLSIAVEEYYDLWAADVKKLSINTHDHDVNHSWLDLYWRTRAMMDLKTSFAESPVDLQIALMFFPAVSSWLDTASSKTQAWVDEALAVDTFSAISENGPSSSVTDLSESLQSVSDFVLNLDWLDQGQQAYFVLKISKIFALSVQSYCSKIERLFVGDMSTADPAPGNVQNERAHVWLEKAKSALASIQGEKRLQVFYNFSPKSCVKLNNIEATRVRLDDLYQRLGVDSLPEVVASNPTDQPGVGSKYLFSIKIVLAEGLVLEGSLKPPEAFVILSNETGARLAKTRTVYDEADPRWDETFDVSLQSPTWLMASIKHRQLGIGHDLLGRAYFRLDPAEYSNMLSNDLLLSLDTGGHLLLRVSMEGERDDTPYHFGRAFRILGRTESDMIRTFVDKMTPVLRHTLSRSSIKMILKPSNAAAIDYHETLGKLSAMYKSVDYNKALGNVSAAYKTAVGANEYAIPLPLTEQGASESSANTSAFTGATGPRTRALKDSDIELAIHPLFDYLEANMYTLASSLSDVSLKNVMIKLWKQILDTIERLVVPPLSDRPSSMRPLRAVELEIVLKWLTFLRNFLHLDGDERGLSESVLNNDKYHELLRISLYYDWSTDDLMEECVRGLQTTLKYKSLKPSKTVLSQRNLGSIRARKSAKHARRRPENVGSSEMIMRILRMRPGTQDFLNQILQTVSVVKLDQPTGPRTSIRA
ncbi:hypothetical protein BD324DRAFT_635534 [Kockovaella imperatae]|uniref:Uncharacterized protein n=1 Tax=Kockovaella imperatae TaxID=4999 RepID=A0A1Y1U8I3_9TREE|nr:hypothetical protein BD324DRAFT_635534 [Kockovaella imperatae]ORX34349.1 hypothetical protein BD324DRAFT_635534 [Kockovaella imperatae]